MIYVMLQSVVILSLVFGGGLWFGGALSKWTEKPAPRTARVQAAEPEEIAPAYRGFDLSPEPETRLQAAAVPAPVVQAPTARQRVPLLYPVNQFGVLSVTRARTAV